MRFTRGLAAKPANRIRITLGQRARIFSRNWTPSISDMRIENYQIDLFGGQNLQTDSTALGERWAMKTDNRSPKFTTCWDELPTVHAH